MSRSVGSGPMPQADTAAAPAPVTPRTFRKRLRSIESVISVVAHAAIAGHVVLDVAAHAPSHPQRGHLFDLWHFRDVAVAGHTRRGAEGLDVPHVGKAHEPGQGVDAHPLRRFPLAPRVADLLDLGLMGRRGAADQLVAPDAGLERRDSRLAGDRGRVVAVHARDLILPGMDVVSKEDRLAWPLEITGVADDGSLERGRR